MRPGCLLQWPSPSYLGVSEFARAKDSVMQGSKGWWEEHSAGYLPYTNNKLLLQMVLPGDKSEGQFTYVFEPIDDE